MFFNANEASVYRALLAFIFVAKILAGFPLFKQRGINYPPTFVGFETKRCLKSIRQDGWWKVEPSMLERRNVDRCDWYIKSMEQHFLSYNPL